MKKSKTCQVFFLHLGNRKTEEDGETEREKNASRKQTNSVKMRQIVRQKLLYTLCRHFSRRRRKGGKEEEQKEMKKEWDEGGGYKGYAV